jgi:IMP cyclohydrolase
MTETVFSRNERTLMSNIYPGRGIILGKSPDGSRYVQVYWLTGRSENSRNRVFVQDGDFVRTKAFDESKCSDPSLIIYYPVRNSGAVHIVSNGDQTDTVYESVRKGGSAESALFSRTYEPDAPNFTPRITGVIDCAAKKCFLSILKKQAESAATLRGFYNFEELPSGVGYCIHTYLSDGNPLPSFSGEPYPVALADSDKETAEKFWSLLNKENRVSLLVKSFALDGSDSRVTILNRFK